MCEDFLCLARDLDILMKDRETGETVSYLSRIEEMGERSLLISPPFRKGNYGQLLKVELGEKLSACISRERCSYFFESEMLGVPDVGNGFWEISRPDNIRKEQRRQYVRLEILLDVTLEFFDGEYKSVTAFTKDISAGGVQVVLEEKPPEIGVVRVSLPLAPDFSVEAQGEILRVALSRSMKERFLAAIKFSDLPKAKQEEIVKYIFRQEIERRKKRKR